MSETLVVAADHPSLDERLVGFIGTLRAESRRFGPRARSNPKPFPSLLQELDASGGFRLAAMRDDGLVGLLRVDADGSIHVAIAEAYRGIGVGTELVTAAVARAGSLGYRRLTLRSSRRSRAVRRLGDRLGCTSVELGRGRVDLILPIPSPAATSA